jgi:uncharacterized membrane protein YphA (DoxX/SURF4 family)
MKIFRTALAGIITFALPLGASAHEVYVLSKDQIRYGSEAAPFPMLPIMLEDMHRFMFWAVLAAAVVLGVFLLSISRRLERRLDPALGRMKRYAPVVSRVTIGVALIASSVARSSFGPELPLAETFGSFAAVVDPLLLVLGVLIIIGLWTRVAAVLALGIYAANVLAHGEYMLTYLNYFGEFVVLLILGAHAAGLDVRKQRRKPALERRLAPLAFPLLRVCFGVSFIFSSLYAKVLHNQLAFMVANENFAGHTTSLASALGFEPHFLVFGAAIVEVVIGLFFVLGVEIRFTALFVEFWLALSLWYFGESVWPHIVLIGIPLAFILHGYDKYSLEGLFFKKGGREPVL